MILELVQCAALIAPYTCCYAQKNNILRLVMNSSIDLLNRLLEEGQKFTFENSSGNDSYNSKMYSGPDTPG